MCTRLHVFADVTQNMPMRLMGLVRVCICMQVCVDVCSFPRHSLATAQPACIIDTGLSLQVGLP